MYDSSFFEAYLQNKLATSLGLRYPYQGKQIMNHLRAASERNILDGPIVTIYHDVPGPSTCNTPLVTCDSPATYTIIESGISVRPLVTRCKGHLLEDLHNLEPRNGKEREQIQNAMERMEQGF